MLMAGDGDHGSVQKMAMPITAGAQLLKITPRQYEVLVLLSRGYPIKTVSRMLNISVATAKTHACTLYQRLQVKNKGRRYIRPCNVAPRWIGIRAAPMDPVMSATGSSAAGSRFKSDFEASLPMRVGACFLHWERSR